MKLSGLFLLLIFGLAACFRVSSESSPPANITLNPSTASIENPQLPQDAAVVPILEMNMRGILGGSKGGRWLRAKDVAPNLKAKQSYKFFGLESSASSEVIGEQPTNDAPCEEFYNVDFNKSERKNGVAFGSQISWNPVPRPVKKIAVNSPVYRKIVTDVLKSKGLPKSAPKVTQILQTDLDGDGRDEIVLSATNFKKGLSSRGSVGDYSFVLLRKVTGKNAENFVLAGDFIKNAANAGAPSEYRVSGLADLNGDGKMEAVIFSHYYEGESVEVFQSKDGKMLSVEELTIACGS